MAEILTAAEIAAADQAHTGTSRFLDTIIDSYRQDRELHPNADITEHFVGISQTFHNAISRDQAVVLLAAAVMRLGQNP